GVCASFSPEVLADLAAGGDEGDVVATAPELAGAEAGAVDVARAPAVTWGRILVIVLFETPAFARSSTEASGRPAIIFFAVAEPTPGSSSSSFALAWFRSTGPDVFASSFDFFSGFSAALDLAGGAAA